MALRKKMSTTQTICSIYERMTNNMNCSLYTCCVFLDLTKAFDTVTHALLLHKMEHNFRVCGLPLQLLKSYLSNRYQYAKINDCKSSLLKVSCRVSQGSSLEPLFFFLYISDLPQICLFDNTLFAVDTLMLSDKNLNNLENKVSS